MGPFGAPDTTPTARLSPPKVRGKGSHASGPERQVAGERAQDESKDTGCPEVPGTLRRDAFVDAEAQPRRGKPHQPLEHHPPAEHGDDHGQPRPDVVERDDQRSAVEAEQSLQEHGAAALATQPHEELHPGQGLQGVRQADAEQAHRDEALNRPLHARPPANASYRRTATTRKPMWSYRRWGSNRW